MIAFGLAETCEGGPFGSRGRSLTHHRGRGDLSPALLTVMRRARKASGPCSWAVLRPQGPLHCHLSVVIKRGRPPVVKGVLVGDLFSKSSLPRLMLPATLTVCAKVHSVTALIDSGAEQNFIDSALTEKLGIVSEPLPNRLHVTALSGQQLPDITHVSEPVSLTLSGNHTEVLSLFVFKAPQTPLVLGHPWLRQHNPHIDWKSELVVGCGVDCHMNCLRAATPPSASPQTNLSEHPDLTSVPPVYHDLAEVFRKDRAQSLPPQWPYDCAIDLLPGATLPTSRLYSLSQPEREAMEKYITDSLAAGIIWPSSSPVAAGFFFVEKKDKTLRPCIDYLITSQLKTNIPYRSFPQLLNYCKGRQSSVN